MNLSLVLFVCQIVIVVSWVQHNSEPSNQTAENEPDLNDTSQPTKSSLDNIHENITPIFGNNGNNSLMQLLPLIPIITELIKNIVHVIKEQIAFTQAPSVMKIPGNHAFINQTRTECRSKSSTSSGGMNCVTTGLIVGGLTTIFVVLAISFGMKIAQIVKEISTNTVQPQKSPVHHSPPPFNNQLFGQPPNKKLINNIYSVNGHQISSDSSRPYKTSNLNIGQTISLVEPKILRELRNNNAITLDPSHLVRRLGRSDEVLHDYDRISHNTQ